MDVEVTVPFGNLTDAEIVGFGFEAGKHLFEYLLNEGALSRDSLALEVGEILDITKRRPATSGEYGVNEIVADDNGYRRLGTDQFGTDAAPFVRNISAENGKLATVIRYATDSIRAWRDHGEAIPEGPQRWPGGVYLISMVEINGEWRIRVFVGAASGVQGSFDIVVISTVLVASGAAWIEREKALAGVE